MRTTEICEIMRREPKEGGSVDVEDTELSPEAKSKWIGEMLNDVNLKDFLEIVNKAFLYRWSTRQIEIEEIFAVDDIINDISKTLSEV